MEIPKSAPTSPWFLYNMVSLAHFTLEAERFIFVRVDMELLWRCNKMPMGDQIWFHNLVLAFVNAHLEYRTFGPAIQRAVELI